MGRAQIPAGDTLRRAVPTPPEKLPGPSPPWLARRAGSGGRGCCRGYCLTAGARAAGSSAPRPWQGVLRASARVLPHEVLRAGYGVAERSLSVLFTLHHVLGWKRNALLNFMKGEEKKKKQTKQTQTSKTKRS